MRDSEGCVEGWDLSRNLKDGEDLGSNWGSPGEEDHAERHQGGKRQNVY